MKFAIIVIERCVPMKLSTNMTQTLHQKQTLSQRQQYALQILAMSDAALCKETEKMLEENPLFELSTDWDMNISNRDLYERASQIVSQPETLQDILYAQLHLCKFDLPYELAEHLIASLDEDGYLRMSDEEIEEAFAYPIDVIEDTIAILQGFEPAGVFARNLQECLLIQLCFADIPYSQTAIMIVNYHMQELADHAYEDIATALDISTEEVLIAVSLIQSLAPRPGAAYAKPCAYSIPDAIITIEDGDIHIDMLRNTKCFSIDEQYANIQDDIASAYVKKAMREAQLFIDSLDKRNQTLTAILACICKHQEGFFLHHEPYAPLTMQMIATELGFHESTISRALSLKTIEFEQRIIPLKDFFPSQVNGQSSTYIQQRLLALVKQEPKQKPYSDSQLVNLLKQEKIEISRRTVAKYREQCHIPAVAKRRRND